MDQDFLFPNGDWECMVVFQSELPAGSQIIEVKEDTSLTAGTTIHTVMVGDQATQAAKQKGWYFVTVTC